MSILNYFVNLRFCSQQIGLATKTMSEIFTYAQLFSALPPVLVPKSSEPLPARKDFPPINLDGTSIPKNATYVDGMSPSSYGMAGKINDCLKSFTY